MIGKMEDLVNSVFAVIAVINKLQNIILNAVSYAAVFIQYYIFV